MDRLKGKNIVLAGATGTIGRAVVRHLQNSGANLFLLGRDASKLHHIAQEYEIPIDHSYVIDVTKEDTIHQASYHIHQMIPAVDILINATGIGIIKPFEQMSLSDFDTSIAVNLRGAFTLLQAFLPAMREQKKGLIINIPGVLGRTPMAGATAYAASKYGLNGMMKSLREDLKRTEIRITQLYLGGVDSGFWDTIDLRIQRDKMILADEAAKAIWYLCHQPNSGVVAEMVIQPFNHQVI